MRIIKIVAQKGQPHADYPYVFSKQNIKKISIDKTAHLWYNTRASLRCVQTKHAVRSHYPGRQRCPVSAIRYSRGEFLP